VEPGKWPKPPSALRHVSAHRAAVGAAVAFVQERKDCVERRMPVAGRLVQEPASVGRLVAEDASDHLLGLGRWIADERIVVRSVKRGGDVIVQVAVFVLDHQGADRAVGLLGYRLAVAEIRQRKKARRIRRQRFVVLFEDFLEDAQWVVLWPHAQGTHGHERLRGVIDFALRRGGIDGSGGVDEFAGFLLAAQQECNRFFLVRQPRAECLMDRAGVSHCRHIAIGAVGHADVIGIDSRLKRAIRVRGLGIKLAQTAQHIFG
jgi:hypothetical protein